MDLIDSFNAHGLSHWYQTLAGDYTASYPLAHAMNEEQDKAYYQPFISAFPDLHFDMQRTLADGDYVVIHWMASGTHTEPLTPMSGENISPTEKK